MLLAILKPFLRIPPVFNLVLPLRYPTLIENLFFWLPLLSYFMFPLLFMVPNTPHIILFLGDQWVG